MKYLLKNVLTNKERKKLIEDAKPYLIDGEDLNLLMNAEGYSFPGKQTAASDFEDIPDFKDPLNKIITKIRKKLDKDLVIDRAWVNWTNGKKKDMGWHNHWEFPYAAVYYMKTFPFFSNGTLFEDGLTKAPQNSVLIFPGYLNHTAPSSPLRFDRYSMAFNIRYPTDRSRKPPFITTTKG